MFKYFLLGGFLKIGEYFSLLLTHCSCKIGFHTHKIRISVRLVFTENAYLTRHLTQDRLESTCSQCNGCVGAQFEMMTPKKGN